MGHVPRCPLLAVVIGSRGHVRRGPFFASRDWFTGGTWSAGPAFSALCSSVRSREERRTSRLGCGPAGSTGSSGSAGALGHRCRPWGWRLGWHRRPGLEAVPTSAVPRAGGVEAAAEVAREAPRCPAGPCDPSALRFPAHFHLEPGSGSRGYLGPRRRAQAPPTAGAFVVHGAALRQRTAERVPSSRSWELRLVSHTPGSGRITALPAPALGDSVPPANPRVPPWCWCFPPAWCGPSRVAGPWRARERAGGD
eukprot:bmy_14354T0